MTDQIWPPVWVMHRPPGAVPLWGVATLTRAATGPGGSWECQGTESYSEALHLLNKRLESATTAGVVAGVVQITRAGDVGMVGVHGDESLVQSDADAMYLPAWGECLKRIKWQVRRVDEQHSTPGGLTGGAEALTAIAAVLGHPIVTVAERLGMTVDQAATAAWSLIWGAVQAAGADHATGSVGDGMYLYRETADGEAPAHKLWAEVWRDRWSRGGPDQPAPPRRDGGPHRVPPPSVN